jgi:hypothetical protein
LRCAQRVASGALKLSWEWYSSGSSATPILPRRASAICQSWASYPTVAAEGLDFFGLFLLFANIYPISNQCGVRDPVCGRHEIMKGSSRGHFCPMLQGGARLRGICMPQVDSQIAQRCGLSQHRWSGWSGTMTVYVYAVPLSDTVKQLLNDPKATRELLLGLAEGRDEIAVGLFERTIRIRPMRGKPTNDPSPHRISDRSSQCHVEERLGRLAAQGQCPHQDLHPFDRSGDLSDHCSMLSTPPTSPA